MSAFWEELDRLRLMVEARLELYFAQSESDGLRRAMRYSALAGGKRLRPILTLKFCEAAGGDMEAALDAACAAELIHAYSLIHDDLPCMDDDDMRRGKPSNHAAFGEWRALLAGDALQAEAFLRAAESRLPPERVVKISGELARAAYRMCLGQSLDMESESEPIDEARLLLTHEQKTCALIEAACCMGVYAAGGTAFQIDAAKDYARSFGIAFQIRDDVLDAIGDEKTLGKPVGSDERNGKTTFYTLYGEEECRRAIDEYTARAVLALGGFSPAKTEFLCALAEKMAAREK
ncbi:MAG: polyprenyl synthetase family protein [Oscillospiraceae bacterium]|nr:polyprenyl synthetase family protein [Oscillospiraceae bacterium]